MHEVSSATRGQTYRQSEADEAKRGSTGDQQDWQLQEAVPVQEMQLRPESRPSSEVCILRPAYGLKNFPERYATSKFQPYSSPLPPPGTAVARTGGGMHGSYLRNA